MNGKLYIDIDGAKSVVDIKGETATILFLWAGLTNIICKKLHISPFTLAATLPGLVSSHDKTVAGGIDIDLAAMRRQREGGGQP